MYTLFGQTKGQTVYHYDTFHLKPSVNKPPGGGLTHKMSHCYVTHDDIEIACYLKSSLSLYKSYRGRVNESNRKNAF